MADHQLREDYSDLCGRSTSRGPVAANVAVPAPGNRRRHGEDVLKQTPGRFLAEEEEAGVLVAGLGRDHRQGQPTGGTPMIKRIAAGLAIVAFAMTVLCGGTASADRDHCQHESGVAPTWYPIM
jgi:hypothetical protein